MRLVGIWGLWLQQQPPSSATLFLLSPPCHDLLVGAERVLGGSFAGTVPQT
jgi:hypothetical protein